MAIQNTAGNITKKTVRIPLVGNAQQRSTTLDKDQKFSNVIIETSTNSVSNTKKLYLVKRPGITLYDEVISSAEGRGCWYFAGSVYTIFDEYLYKDGVYLQELSTTTGMCGATEFVDNENYGKQGLFIADGVDAWTVSYEGVVTRVDNKHLQWEANTIIEVGDRRVPTALGTYWYICITSGTTDATEPIWDVTNTDGTVEWVRGGTYTGPIEYQTSYAYSIGDLLIPSTESGYWYKVTVAGTSGGGEPTWPLVVGDTVTSGGVTFVCEGEYGGFPTPHVPTPVYMDGYIALPDANSHDIYNCNITKPYSWGALSFTSAESFPDQAYGLARQNNYIVAFGENSIEFLYNEAKANQLTDFDSPFTTHETLIMQVGVLTKNSIFSSEKTIMFIGSSSIGGHSVWRIDGNIAKEISTEYIEKFIDLETNASAISGFGFRINGHFLFVINLPTANRTFVYDLEEGFWVEWDLGGDALPFCSFCDANGELLVQHKTNGNMYKLSVETFDDFGTPITVKIVLAKQDFETDNRKFFHQTVVIGDICTDPISLSWSDDDYESWATDKVLSANIRPYFTRSGSARRRAWRLKHTGNSRLRLEALEVTYSIGTH